MPDDPFLLKCSILFQKTWIQSKAKHKSFFRVDMHFDQYYMNNFLFKLVASKNNHIKIVIANSTVFKISVFHPPEKNELFYH